MKETPFKDILGKTMKVGDLIATNIGLSMHIAVVIGHTEKSLRLRRLDLDPRWDAKQGEWVEDSPAMVRCNNLHPKYTLVVGTEILDLENPGHKLLNDERLRILQEVA